VTRIPWRQSAADLGMLSMFGRTGAPQKGGPTKAAANFLHARNTEIMGDPRVNQKIASFSGELTAADTRTLMTKERSPVFSR